MTKLDIVRLKQMFSSLNNEKRIMIIELCSEKEYTITQLSKKIGLDYSVTVEYVSMLKRANLIEKKRNEDKTVSVKSLIRLNNNGEISIA
ncbi:MAG: winged helix-turn-helix domain-containing protein [Nanoarchaeota archaeon]